MHYTKLLLLSCCISLGHTVYTLDLSTIPMVPVKNNSNSEMLVKAYYCCGSWGEEIVRTQTIPPKQTSVFLMWLGDQPGTLKELEYMPTQQSDKPGTKIEVPRINVSSKRERIPPIVLEAK